MKIEKYVKDKNNKYKVYIDNEGYVLYDDIIAKYQLLFKSDIDKEELDNIIKDNTELSSYYQAIKYITKKLRSEKEIDDYLIKYGVNKDIRIKTINKLKENKFINDSIFLKAYINDQINLTNNGPVKIKKCLLKLGIASESIDYALYSIDENIWVDKIANYINKKSKLNKSDSELKLKMKLKMDLINLGYDKSLIESKLVSFHIDDTDIKKKEYEKIKKKLSLKYEGYELEQKIKEKMYRKGFKVSSYEE